MSSVSFLTVVLTVLYCGQTQEKPKPTLRVNPHTTVYTGDTLTLTCDLQSSGWVFMWYKVSYQLELLSENGPNTLSLTASDTGTTVYQCIAYRGEYASEYSDPVEITVKEKTPKPTLRVNPHTTVYTGDTLTLTCDLQSSGWVFMWYKVSYQLELLSENGPSTLSLTASDTGTTVYQCVAYRGAYGSEYSDPVKITVKEKIPKPTLRVNPHTTVYTGDTLTLTCDLQSSGWVFMWYKVSYQLELLSENGPNTLSLTASDTGTTVYQCIAYRGAYGSEYSDPVKITVKEKIPKPTLRVNPHTTVYTGDTLTLTCDLKISHTGWMFRWYKASQPLQPLTPEYKNTNTLSITASDTAEYQCSALRGENDFTQLSDSVRITVREKPKPTLRVNPHTTVYTGDTLTLTCDLQSSLTGWKFMWFRVSQLLQPLTPEYKNTNTLSITASDTAEYQCSALRGENIYTDYSDPVKITVKEKPKPTLMVNPHTTVYTGDTLTLTCDLKISLTGWKFMWFRVSQLLQPLTPEYKNTNTLSITASDTAEYQCSALRGENSYTDDSDPVKITVKEKPKPTLRVNPHTTVYTGDTLTLTCDLKISHTGWKFMWFRVSQQLQPLTPEYKNTNTLSITASDTAEYQCSALRGENSYTDYSDPVKITVREKPKPTVRVDPPTTVRRTVREWTPIPEATSTPMQQHTHTSDAVTLGKSETPLSFVEFCLIETGNFKQRSK
ncbi:pregnancy-specific beta-1-glycoprotein 1-like [Astyanax mexicanus]|uniref:Pregnancy-specific beta-1-glycoprotein 1-like n=1 Tax=Astyanax mexicanus TaxID=7994 RepID=A0A8T2LQT4_ASTMX|nr:pregnancy-specific beta-1-glycoprotein 1-like [Astyanax mexicanus]